MLLGYFFTGRERKCDFCLFLSLFSLNWHQFYLTSQWKKGEKTTFQDDLRYFECFYFISGHRFQRDFYSPLNFLYNDIIFLYFWKKKFSCIFARKQWSMVKTNAKCEIIARNIAKKSEKSNNYLHWFIQNYNTKQHYPTLNLYE